MSLFLARDPRPDRSENGSIQVSMKVDFFFFEKSVQPATDHGASGMSHPGQHGQVVVSCVEDPHDDVAHNQLLGKLKAHADVLEVQAFKAECNKNQTLVTSNSGYVGCRI